MQQKHPCVCVCVCLKINHIHHIDSRGTLGPPREPSFMQAGFGTRVNADTHQNQEENIINQRGSSSPLNEGSRWRGLPLSRCSTWSQSKPRPSGIVHQAHQLSTAASTQLSARRHFIHFYPFLANVWSLRKRREPGEELEENAPTQTSVSPRPSFCPSLTRMLACLSRVQLCPVFGVSVDSPDFCVFLLLISDQRRSSTTVDRTYLIGDVHHQIVFTLVPVTVLGGGSTEKKMVVFLAAPPSAAYREL